MSTQLGTLDELPPAYLDQLSARNAQPLWPSMRSVLPYDIPDRQTQPHIWRYKELRPLLMEAGTLTPIEKAERRVLMLTNPGHAPQPFATSTIFFGLQLILPGESAPTHKHSPSAVRLIVEGEGGFTTVEGQRCPMEKGDVILTPSGLWHEHEHGGTGPMVWLDALDLPVIGRIEASYCTEGNPQSAANRPDASQTRFRRSGLVPYESLGRPPQDYPLMRYPWAEVREALQAIAGDSGPNEAVQLAYVNPETGRECMPILGFSAIMLRPGEELSPRRRSASCGFLAVEGRGEAKIDDTGFAWEEDDVFVAPTHADIRLRNASSKSPAYLIQVDDAPMQRKLGFYEEFGNGRA